MLKIVVFDSGWGGELFADYLEKELSVVEVIRVIDWRNAPYADKSSSKARELMENALKPYLGKVEIIVIASYIASSIGLQWLRKQYPDQKFVGFVPKLEMVADCEKDIKRVVVLGHTQLIRSKQYQSEKSKISSKNSALEVIEPPCSGWTEMIDEGTITDEIIKNGLSCIDWRQDLLMLYSTHFVDLRDNLERIFGWKVRVADDFRAVLREVCKALEFKGGDGRKSRK